MTVCRTLGQVLAAAVRDSRDYPPLSQEQVNLTAALLAATQTTPAAAA